MVCQPLSSVVIAQIQQTLTIFAGAAQAVERAKRGRVGRGAGLQMTVAPRARVGRHGVKLRGSVAGLARAVGHAKLESR